MDKFVEEICTIPGGEGIRLCIQCGTCTASCPNMDVWIWRGLFLLAGLIIIALATKETIDKDLPKEKK